MTEVLDDSTRTTALLKQIDEVIAKERAAEAEKKKLEQAQKEKDKPFFAKKKEENFYNRERERNYKKGREDKKSRDIILYFVFCSLLLLLFVFLFLFTPLGWWIKEKIWGFKKKKLKVKK